MLDEIERRRNEASNRSLHAPVRERINAAPSAYILAQTADDLVRHAQLCEPAPRRGEVRVRVDQLECDRYRVEIATRDRIGLIAHTTRVLLDAQCSVDAALAATWGDGTALTSYRVHAPAEPDEETLAHTLRSGLDAPLEAPAAPNVDLEFDDEGSPWYTRVHGDGCRPARTTAYARNCIRGRARECALGAHRHRQGARNRHVRAHGPHRTQARRGNEGRASATRSLTGSIRPAGVSPAGASNAAGRTSTLARSAR